jgi:hypothetical protein
MVAEKLTGIRNDSPIRFFAVSHAASDRRETKIGIRANFAAKSSRFHRRIARFTFHAPRISHPNLLFIAPFSDRSTHINIERKKE